MSDFSSTGDASMDMGVAAATLLSDNQDIQSLFKALATTFSDTLGDRLTIERAGGRFRKSEEMKSITIGIGDDEYVAVLSGHGADCSVGHTSGGIRLRNERVDIAEWLKRLLDSLQREATHSSNARLALENIVIGGPA